MKISFHMNFFGKKFGGFAESRYLCTAIKDEHRPIAERKCFNSSVG